MQFQDNPGAGVAVGAVALAQYRLLKADGTVTGLDATKDWIGVTLEPRAALAKSVPVRFPTAGTIPCTAAAAISIGDVVYKAAAGKVSTASTGSIRVGIAKTAASADGDWLEVYPG